MFFPISISISPSPRLLPSLDASLLTLTWLLKKQMSPSHSRNAETETDPADPSPVLRHAPRPAQRRSHPLLVGLAPEVAGAFLEEAVLKRAE